MRFLGPPVYRYIDIEDSEAVIRAIRSTPPNQPIALVLHTPSGLALAASQIAIALKRHRKIVIVPHYAMSCGTLVALVADEIIMDPDAVPGPLDPQIPVGNVAYPAPSLIEIAKLKSSNARDEFLMLANVAEKAIAEMQDVIIKLLEDKPGTEKAMEIARVLTKVKYAHNYPITV